MSRMLQVSSKERKSQGDTWEYSLHIRKQAEVGNYSDTHWISSRGRDNEYARAMFKGHSDPSLFLFHLNESNGL